MSRIPVLLLSICVFASLPTSGQQAATGAIVGVVREGEGGTIPGAVVTARTGKSQHTAISDKEGRYRIADLPPDVYRVEAELPGFRRALSESIVVSAGKETDCPLTLLVGVITVVDYVFPAGGFPEAVKQAQAVARLRVTRYIGTELVGRGRNQLVALHEATIAAVMKGGDRLTNGPTQFLQMNAGNVVDDGLRHSGQNRVYSPGDEFIGLLEWTPDGRLTEYLGGNFMFPIRNGIVITKGPIQGVRPGMPVDEFVATLQKLIPR